MGSCQPEPYNTDIWYKVSPGVLHNVDTDEEMEVHRHQFDPNDEQEFITAYELRRTPIPPFVRVLDYQLTKGILGGATAVVYTQRIFRLHEIELSIPEAIYMLRECVLAFCLLFEEYGPFEIREGMIGVNQKGRAKVWISENFSENDVRDSAHIPDYITEQDFVFDLAELIENQLDADHLSAFLLPYQGRLNFQTALKIIESVQAKDLVKVDRVFLDDEEYNRYLSKQLLASGVASTMQTNSNQVTTTTTTTTTTTQLIPQVVPQPQPVMVVPNYNQLSRLVVYPEPPPITYDVGYALQPGSSGHTNYALPVIPIQPPVAKPLIPYQKVAQQNIRPRREQPMRVANRQVAEQNDYLRPMKRAPRQPNLQRVMPTTEKNWKERELQLLHREKFKEISMVESRIIKAPAH